MRIGIGNSLTNLFGAPTVAPPSTGLVFWGKPETLSGSTGSAVSTWTNSAGGTDATQGTAGNRPVISATTANGFKGVQSTADAKCLTVSGISLDAKNNTILVVTTPANITAQGIAILGGGFPTVLYLTQSGGSKPTLGGYWFYATNTGNLNGVCVYNSHVVGKHQLYGYRVSSGAYHFVRNDGLFFAQDDKQTIIQQNTTKSDVVTLTTTGLTICSDPSFGYYKGTIHEVMVWSRGLSNSEIQQVQNYVRAKYGWAAEKRVICVGDSLTYGYTAAVTASYPQKLRDLRSNAEYIVNWGLSGQALGAGAGSIGGGGFVAENVAAPTFLFPATSSSGLYASWAAKNVIVLWIGTNDIGSFSRTQNQLQTDTTNYVTAAKAAGFTIVVCTIIPRGGGLAGITLANFRTAAQGFNSWLMGVGNPSGADARLDFTANQYVVGTGSATSAGATGGDATAFSDFSASYNDSTYYNTTEGSGATLTHLTATGYGVIAGMVNTTLTAIL